MEEEAGENINIFNQNQQVQNSRLLFERQNIFNAFVDQNATILLQKKLSTLSAEDIDYIINQLKGTFREIMKDKNGNYFCKDLFKECNQEQRIKILSELYQTLSEDCINNYSCHPIQTLIERASSELEYKLILDSFIDYKKMLSSSSTPKGAYTIQKIIERIPDRCRIEFNFIFSSIIGFTSRDKFGIVTVKKFISETKSDSITDLIMKLIKQNFMNLAVDQYANYLIQFLLEKWINTPEGNEIKNLIFVNFDKLMQKKYSSFICETYIKIISSEEKNNLINTLINTLNIDAIFNSNNNYPKKILKKLGIINNSNNNGIPNNLNNNNINNQINFIPNNNINNHINLIPNNININNQNNLIPNNNNINNHINLIPNNININNQNNLIPDNNINYQDNFMPNNNTNSQINIRLINNLNNQDNTIDNNNINSLSNIRFNNNLNNQGNSMSNINLNDNNQNIMFFGPNYMNNFYSNKK